MKNLKTKVCLKSYGESPIINLFVKLDLYFHFLFNNNNDFQVCQDEFYIIWKYVIYKASLKLLSLAHSVVAVKVYLPSYVNNENMSITANFGDKLGALVTNTLAKTLRQTLAWKIEGIKHLQNKGPQR